MEGRTDVDTVNKEAKEQGFHSFPNTFYFSTIVLMKLIARSDCY